MPAISLVQKQSAFKNAARSAFAFIVRPFWPVLPRSLYLGQSPKRLILAITRKCNINCVFCAYQFARKEDKIHMPNPVFELVLEEIQKIHIERVMLSPNIGEPLLAPNFINKIKQLRTAGVRFIEVTTNGSLLHIIGPGDILENGPDKINISFPGFNKEMYERDVRAQLYERTRDNIVGLLRLNKSMGRPKSINLWLRGDLSAAELMSAPEMEEVKELADDISIMTEVDDWTGLIKEEHLPQGYHVQERKPPIGIRPCSLLFDLTVHPDGDIHLCSCRNLFEDPDLHIGHIKDMSFLDAHKRIPEVLKRWEMGQIPITCRRCSMYCDPSIGFIGRFREMHLS